jgi:hypothetical protein
LQRATRNQATGEQRQWDPATVRIVRRLLLWVVLLALAAGVLLLISVIAYSLGHGDQAVSHHTAVRVVVVRDEQTTVRRPPYLMAAVALALTGSAFWYGWRQRRHHA